MAAMSKTNSDATAAWNDHASFTSDSELGHTKKNQRAVMLIITRMGKAKGRKARGFRVASLQLIWRKNCRGTSVQIIY